MSAPDHLRPLLEVLGTGGTTEMARRIHGYVAGLHAQVDGLHAQVAGLARVLVEEHDVTEPGETACDAAVRVLRGQAAEIRRLNTLLEPARAAIRDLIEASSLGTPDAVAARESVPVEVAQAVIARATSEDDEDAAVYPYRSGDHIVIGPEAFAADDGTVLCWRGVNYTPIPGEVPNVPDVDYPPATKASFDAFVAAFTDADTPNPATSGAAVLPELVHDPADPGPLPDLPASAYPPDSTPLDAEDDDWDDTPEPASPPAEAPRVVTNDEIRAWCRSHGVPVSDRGPIGKTARTAYNARQEEQ